MAIKVITLTTQGNSSGPLYNVFWSTDCVNYTALTGSTPIFLPTIGSNANIDLPASASCIKLVNNNDVCDNEVITYVGPPTTTTTTTLAPTTTTTAGPTTTTTTSGVTTTTTAAATTTTTAAATTTTTTISPTTCYTLETVQSSQGECFGCPGFFASTTDTIMKIFTACSGSQIFPPFAINVESRYSDNSTSSLFIPAGYTSSIIIATSDTQCIAPPTCGEIASPTFVSASVVAVSASITQCCI